jgi:hypothetical protein
MEFGMQAKIARLSAVLEALTSVALVLLPLAVVWSVVQGLTDPEAIRARFSELPVSTAIPPGKAAAVAALGLVTLIPALVALWRMRALFSRYRRGEILTPPAAELIRGIGGALVVLALAGVLLRTAQVLVLTLDNPDGQKILAISFDGDFLGFLLSGGLLVVIGWAMREAARAAEENASFV